jgi:hypothetical protein
VLDATACDHWGVATAPPGETYFEAGADRCQALLPSISQASIRVKVLSVSLKLPRFIAIPTRQTSDSDFAGEMRLNAVVGVCRQDVNAWKRTLP